ncbi:MAG: phosphatidylserine decarboxylase, partial [Ruminococcus sp.]|nr:phosphatidylserine decarboxylase [Ruminococcus sp.]
MKVIDRNGVYYETDGRADRLLKDIYAYKTTRACMKLLTEPFVSKAAGILLDSRASAAFIDQFADSRDIDLYDFENKEYSSFNDFFTRRFKKGHRVIDEGEDALICPCDGNVSAYSIADSDMFVIKNTVYSVNSMLRDKKLADKYSGGTAIIIRLTAADPHRYIYPCSGIKSHDRHISGRLSVTRPIVNEYEPVFKENTREYCMIRSPLLGDIIQMEIGALGAGRIRNFESGCARIEKGCEKGVFDFGGSTIVLLTEGGRVSVCDDLLE